MYKTIGLQNDSELLSRVDINDTQLGLKKRGEFYNNDLIYRSIGIMLINNEGKILICKRQNHKISEPGVYSHSVDGGVGNETYYSAAKRELREELCVGGDLIGAYKYFFNEGTNTMWKKVYICKRSGVVYPDYNEIGEIKWISRNNLIVSIEKSPNEYAQSFIQSMNLCKKLIRNGEISL